MRRLAVAALIPVVCSLSCVAPKLAEPAPLHQTYRPRPVSPNLPYSRTSTRASRAVRLGDLPASASSRVRKTSNRWTHIVVHHSATRTGGAKVFDKHHREDNGWDELGYHFVIGNGTDTADGLVEVGPRWRKQKHGAHCKTPDNYFNEHGIGICLVGDFTKTRPTRRQLASLYRLTQFLSDRCNIPPSRVTTHGRINRKTQCPGTMLNLADLRRSLATTPSASSMP